MINDNRQKVKVLWECGIRSSAEISKRTCIPLRSCERYVALLRKIGRIPEIHHPGRPRKTSPNKRHQIGQIIKNNPFATANEIKARLEETHPGFEVGEHTIRTELTKLGYSVVLSKRVPLLTEYAKENRLQWARDHLHYNWCRVVFSDETTLQMFRNT